MLKEPRERKCVQSLGYSRVNSVLERNIGRSHTDSRIKLWTHRESQNFQHSLCLVSQGITARLKQAWQKVILLRKRQAKEKECWKDRRPSVANPKVIIDWVYTCLYSLPTFSFLFRESGRRERSTSVNQSWLWIHRSSARISSSFFIVFFIVSLCCGF